MAKVKTAFLGVKDGEVLATEFSPGDEVDGDLGAVAVREGWAEGDAGAKASSPAENKSIKSAPENK